MKVPLLWRFAEARLGCALPPARRDSIVGDLAEDYARRRHAVGALRAGLWWLREGWSLGRAYRAGPLTGWIRHGWFADGREAFRALRKTPVQTAAIVSRHCAWSR